MGTFKKLFASIAAIMIVVSTAPVAVFGQTSRSAEYQDAYTYAFENSITTMTSIEAANLAGTTTRVAAAKMMSEFAKAMGQTPDTSASCTFSDLAPVAGTDLETYAVEACQLGLMGINTNGIFNPMGVLSRAEFGTVLSRVLFGDTYNGGNPYYAAHLNALNQAGLMNDISNPERSIMRGDAMLLLYKASEADLDGMTPGFCADIETVFACTIDPDGTMGLCPAACLGGDETEEEEEEVATGNEVSGDADVSLANRQPANVVPVAVVGVEIGTIVIEAGNGESLSLNSIEMEATGFGDYADLDDVVLYDDRGTKVTRTRDVNNDGEVVLSFLPGYSIPAGGREELTIATTLNGSTNGDTYGFKVTGLMGPKTLSGLPLTTQQVTAQNVSNLGLLKIQLDTPSGDVEVGTDEILGGFELRNDNDEEDIALLSLRVEQVGSVDSSYLGDLSIVVDGNVVSDEVTVDGDYFTFTFADDGFVLDKDSSSWEQFEIRGTLSGEPQEDVGFVIEEADDIYARGLSKGFRVNVTSYSPNFALTDDGVDGVLDILGSEVIISFDKSDEDSVSQDNTEFNFGTLKVKSASTNYLLEEYTIILDADAAGYDFTSSEIQDVRLGGQLYESYVDLGAGMYALTFEDLDIMQGVQYGWDLTAEFDGATVGDTFKFDLTFVNGQFSLEDLDSNVTYTTVVGIQNLFSSTSFETRTVEVEAAELTITSDAFNADDVVVGNGVELLAAKGEFEANDTSAIEGIDVTFDNNGSADLDDFVSQATLMVGTTEYTATNISAGSIEFNRNITVPAGSANRVDFELVLELKDSTIAVDTIDLEINVSGAEDEDGNVATVIGNGGSFGVFTLAENGSFEIDLDTTEDNVSVYSQFTDQNKYVLAGKDMVVLAKIEVRAQDEDVRIEDLYFDTANSSASSTDILASIDDVFLYDASMVELDKATLQDAGGSTVAIKFENADVVVAQGDRKYMYLVTSLNAINADAAGATAVAGTDIIVQLHSGLFTSRFVGQASAEDITGGDLTYTSTDSFATIVAGNVPSSISLLEREQSIYGNGTYTIAALSVTVDAQSTNRVGGDVVEALLSGLNLTFGTGGAASFDAAFTLSKVGGSQVVTLTGGQMNSLAGLGTDAEIDPGQTETFEIKVTIANATTVSDNGINIQTRISNLTSGVELDDGFANSVFLSLPAGVTRDVSVNSRP